MEGENNQKNPLKEDNGKISIMRILAAGVVSIALILLSVEVFTKAYIAIQCIGKESCNIPEINWMEISFLILSALAPKLGQKFAENKNIKIN